jgi:hypothetical protein
MADPVVERLAAPPDAVFAAAQAVAQQMAKSVDQVDPAGRTIYFNTGMSLSSWNGQNVTARVSDAPEGGSLLEVGAQVKRSGLSSFQVVSWGEGARLSRKFANRVRDQLGASAAGVQSPG